MHAVRQRASECTLSVDAMRASRQAREMVACRSRSPTRPSTATAACAAPDAPKISFARSHARRTGPRRGASEARYRASFAVLQALRLGATRRCTSLLLEMLRECSKSARSTRRPTHHPVLAGWQQFHEAVGAGCSVVVCSALAPQSNSTTRRRPAEVSAGPKIASRSCGVNASADAAPDRTMRASPNPASHAAAISSAAIAVMPHNFVVRAIAVGVCWHRQHRRPASPPRACPCPSSWARRRAESPQLPRWIKRLKQQRKHLTWRAHRACTVCPGVARGDNAKVDAYGAVRTGASTSAKGQRLSSMPLHERIVNFLPSSSRSACPCTVRCAFLCAWARAASPTTPAGSSSLNATMEE